MQTVHSHTSSVHAKSCRRSGLSLVETMLYIAILSFALIALIQTLIVVVGSYRTLRNAERLEEEVTGSLERMVREIRGAYAIDTVGSVLGAHPGKLILLSTDSVGSAKSIEFYLDQGTLMLKENSVAGTLSSAQTRVSNLVFRSVVSARSKGIKVDMTMHSGTSTALRSENFYTTAVLRDSY